MTLATKYLSPLLLALLSLPLIHSLSMAQAPGAPRLAPKVYLGAGYATILNPDAIDNDFKPSYSFQLGVGMPISVGFEVLGRFHYHNFSSENLASFAPLPESDMRIWTIGLDAKWPLAPPLSPVKPYALVGVGKFDFERVSGPTTTDETGLYFNVGGGLDIKFGPSFALFAEAKYTIVATSTESIGIVPMIVGIRIL